MRTLPTAAEKTLQLQGFFDVVHDFLDPAAVKIGDTKVEERYGHTWGELGVGAQGWLNKRTSLFADVRYQQGLSGGLDQREGSSINIGVRHAF